MNNENITKRFHLQSVFAFLHYAVEAMREAGADYDTLNTFKDEVDLATRTAKEYRVKFNNHIYGEKEN